MRIYFDMCSLQRPLDDPTQLRIAMEAEAMKGFLALQNAGRIIVVTSEAHVFEAAADPDSFRRDYSDVIIGSSEFVKISPAVTSRSEQFVIDGVHAMDALHLACAVAAAVDYSCTCDDRLLKRARKIELSPTRVVSPLELMTELNQ